MVSCNKGELLNEGKTKKIFAIADDPSLVCVESKDRITAGDGAKAHDLAGKAVVSTETTCKIFQFLNGLGIKTHYQDKCGDAAFFARRCHMIPIEWVTRRVATGSFLKRNPGVPEGYRFTPPKLETFFKDDANHDPQWSTEQILSANFTFGKTAIGSKEVDRMLKVTRLVFEVLERAWATLDCALIDMKIEFGVDVTTGEIVLADVIDSDSWRLWPSGDKRMMKDKQYYRDLTSVTSEDLQKVKLNFEWVATKLDRFKVHPTGRVAILLGSASDRPMADELVSHCNKFGIIHETIVSSAHKATAETLNFLAKIEDSPVRTVVIAVAGRSNGLGPVTDGNITCPVINCPPIRADWKEDVWSSLRLPSGLGCTTVLGAEAAVMAAAKILAISDHVIWGRIRTRQAYHSFSTGHLS